MLYLLNDFAIELFRNTSPNQVSSTLQKKLDLWKISHQEEIEKESIRKREFVEKYDTPRKERDAAIEKFMETYQKLRNEYEFSPDIKKKAALQKWIAFGANIPAVIQTRTADIYTMYPYGKGKNIMFQ